MTNRWFLLSAWAFLALGLLAALPATLPLF
jgi:hypothetical protein